MRMRWSHWWRCANRCFRVRGGTRGGSAATPSSATTSARRWSRDALHNRARSGAGLNRLFQGALLTGGRVRSETELGHGALSVGSAAVQLARKIFGTLAGRRAMVLGAGEMAELALACVLEEGVQAAIVANRTFERAQVLAERYGAVAAHYEDAWPELANVDLLLCSTASPHAIVDVERIRAAVSKRGDRPLCILDIALPRDVDPAVAEIYNVYLYDLDDLRGVVSANRDRRQKELPAAESIIAEEVETYWQWVAGLAAVPVVTQLREEMHRVREREVAAALQKLRELTPAQRDRVEQLGRSLTNKFLHEPSVRLRAAAANGRGLGVVDAARYLFGLDAGVEATNESGKAEQDTTKGKSTT